MRTSLPAALLALSLGAALGGCVSLGPKVPETLFNLTPAKTAPAGTSASGSHASAVVVLEPEAEQRLAVTRVPVQVDDANVAYLKSAMWVERPARLFQRLVAETIRAKGARLVVESDPGASGLHLSGRLLEMGYDARIQSVVVRYDGVKELPGGKIETRRFESVVPGIEAKAEAVGPALNQAANDVAAQVADWVG
jgi:cholesterol transport system auxiliary component